MIRPGGADYRGAWRILPVAFAMGCGGLSDSLLPPAPPVFLSAVARANPANVLSGAVAAKTSGADSAAVRYHIAGSASAILSVTPAVRVTDDSVLVPVLGLISETHYILQPVAWGPGGMSIGSEYDLVTGALPDDLPAYSAEGSDPSPGFVVFGSGHYGIVIDNSGRVVWYHDFGVAQVLNFMVESSGQYIARPATPSPTDNEPWIEIDPIGEVSGTFNCAQGLRSRLHEALSDGNGGHWLLCDETRTIDLTEYGGVANAAVTGTVIQHVSATNTLLFQWSPFDHFAVGDADLSVLSGPIVNWTHGNALDIVDDGNVVVSFRNLGEITKIDVVTGEVLWRMGGHRNQFTFTGTAMPPFLGQHSARIPVAGQLLLLDNVGDPTESRAERYEINEHDRTARLVAPLSGTPKAFTMIGGSVQALPRDRTLVSFGTAGQVQEYDRDGVVVWRMTTSSLGYVFRATRITSLYAPGVGISP